MAAQPYTFARDLVALLQRQHPGAVLNDFPFYDYADAARTAGSLTVTSTPHSFRLGTGASVFAGALLPAILAARQEVLFVTCFWAESKSLADLSETLFRLAEERTKRRRSSAGVWPEQPPDGPPLRIRIGFSSRSALQKLLHTSSRDGYTYPPATWDTQLGLPSAAVLRAAGIDLQVKSLFFLPFSVMHPKFVIVDRQRALVPSCNVSWEPWLEGCVELTGAAVQPLLSFYAGTWRDELPGLPDTSKAGTDTGTAAAFASDEPDISPVDVDGPGSIVVHFHPNPTSGTPPPPTPTAILPSSHHRNPRFRPLPWQAAAPPPPTPLNLATLHLMATARQSIYVQTPNLTAQPVVDALLAALGRGVDVTIVTGKNMMVLEQIVTGLTTTARCLRKLIKRYEADRAQGPKGRARTYGRLSIGYYQPLGWSKNRRRAAAADDEERALISQNTQNGRRPSRRRRTNSSGFVVDTAEPVRSHVKLTIVDQQHTLLGSGNMDRASWYTSQELGVLFHDGAFARLVKTALGRVLDGRLASVYPEREIDL